MRPLERRAHYTAKPNYPSSIHNNKASHLKEGEREKRKSCTFHPSQLYCGRGLGKPTLVSPTGRGAEPHKKKETQAVLFPPKALIHLALKGFLVEQRRLKTARTLSPEMTDEVGSMSMFVPLFKHAQPCRDGVCQTDGRGWFLAMGACQVRMTPPPVSRNNILTRGQIAR